MCSIAGIYYFSDKPHNIEKSKSNVLKALTSLRQRGPDQSAVYTVQDNCVMAGNRLIIRGNMKEGKMPYKKNGDVLFYNGEIYNFKKLFSKATIDGDAILPTYEKFGTESFIKFDGEFAISIWDEKKKSLILARDPFGTKPVYFSLNKNRLIWASSAHAINQIEEHPLCKATHGPTYKHSYAVQEPYTSYSGIWSIPPGHFLIVNDKNCKLYCYSKWNEYDARTKNTDELFNALEESLKFRLDYDGVVGIPLSAGIDSGIIAFMADKLKIKYHIFSIVKIFGQDTDEKEFILKRIRRLKNVSKVTLIDFGEKEYKVALKEMFLPNYYDSEKFDNGNILMHTVFSAMAKNKIRVSIDGSGGDELFHGYKFRNDFKPVKEWPQYWKKNNYFYSLFTTLLDYTSKADRAGAFFSIESRFPFQTSRLMEASLKLKQSEILKWPLRKYLLERLDYGQPLRYDKFGKLGFSIKNMDKSTMISDMQTVWCKNHNIISLPDNPPIKFPFKIGVVQSNI